jgi:hypothetical protein
LGGGAEFGARLGHHGLDRGGFDISARHLQIRLRGAIGYSLARDFSMPRRGGLLGTGRSCWALRRDV